MKDLRQVYLISWDEAEKQGGDFKDCLLGALSRNLEMSVINPEPRPGYTDGGVNEMGGVEGENHAAEGRA
jgi:hypothetical protein